MVARKPEKSTNFVSSKQKAKFDAIKKITRIVRQHRLTYDEFVYVCQQVRRKVNLKKPKKQKRLPELLTKSELRKFFKTIQKCGDTKHELMLKLLLYTALRVSELINIQVADIDLDNCKIFIYQGKGEKDRYILFPKSFRLALKSYVEANSECVYLFESRLNKPYTARRIQQIVRMYTDQAGLNRSVHPHLLRHQMLTFLTEQGLADSKIQLISGHKSRQSLEIYQHLSLEAVEEDYQNAVKNLDL